MYVIGTSDIKLKKGLHIICIKRCIVHVQSCILNLLGLSKNVHKRMYVHIHMHDVYWYALATEHGKLVNAGWSVEVNTLVGCTSLSVLLAVFIVVTVFVVALFSRLFVWLLQIHEPTKHYRLTWQHCYVDTKAGWRGDAKNNNKTLTLCCAKDALSSSSLSSSLGRLSSLSSAAVVVFVVVLACDAWMISSPWNSLH